MRMRLVLAMAAAAVIAMAAVPGHAATQSGTYVGGGAAGTGVTYSNATAKVGWGGYSFTDVPTAPTQVKIVDAANSGVGYTVCQIVTDSTPSPICGQAGTLTLNGCTPASGVISLTGRGFVAGKRIAVFIDMVSADCEGFGTTGTITLTTT